MPLNDLTSGFSQGVNLYSALMDIQAKKQAREAAAANNEMVDMPGYGPVPKSRLAEMMLEKRKLDIMEQQAKAKNPAAGVMTPGRKSADMAFGKDYVEWQQGGNAKAAQHLAGLGNAISKYQSDPSMGGGIAGQLPDVLLKAVGSKLPEVKQQVASTIQESMRQILGAQFTENEGKRIIANAFDPAISHAENVRRLTELQKQLQQAAEAKQSMADYFDQYGTLTGYQGPRVNFGGLGVGKTGGIVQPPKNKPQNDPLSLAKQILSDPESGPDDIAWAKKQLGQ